MAKANDKRNLSVTFVGLNDDEKAPSLRGLPGK